MTRTAIVTGGLSGLGAATAERLRADGIRVHTLDLAAASEGDPHAADHHQLDISDDAAVAAVAERVGPSTSSSPAPASWGPNKPSPTCP